MKRIYLSLTIGFIILILSLLAIFKVASQKEATPSPQNFKEALFYQTLEDGSVQCELCPNRCLLTKGQTGRCRVRQNIGGRLYSLVYGKPVTIHLDPIEKKPFYHFLPGEKTYSLATVGCNLRCKYCQNWDIAQRSPSDVKSMDYSPEEIVNEAINQGAKIISFTYSEPTVFYEYTLDIAKLARKKGIKTTIISNGYINKEPLEKLLPYIDAIKIDLKGFNDKYYQEIVGGHLEPVLETLKFLAEYNRETCHPELVSGSDGISKQVRHDGEKKCFRGNPVHLEIVNLLVPGLNDSEKEIKEMSLWIKENLGADIPLHFSRFYPQYRLENLPPTPEETVKKARKIAMSVGLKYVYTGNITDEEGVTTFCPDNKEPLIKRKGYFVEENKVNKEGIGEGCKTRIYGVWE